MWRLSLIPVMFSLTASNPLPNMGEVGQAAHGLEPATAAIYFMAVLLIALIARDIAATWRSGSTTNRLATSIDKSAQVMANDGAQARADMAVILHVLDRIVSELDIASKERAEIARALAKK